MPCEMDLIILALQIQKRKLKNMNEKGGGESRFDTPHPTPNIGLNPKAKFFSRHQFAF